MDFFCIGLSHHTAPVSVRERLALTPERQAELLKRIGATEGVEVSLISTCNRVEFYVAARAMAELKPVLRREIAGIAGEDALQYTYEHDGERAFVHLFRVACSLDSMVVGEPQILGQVKDGLEVSQQTGTVHGELSRAYAAAFSTAKRVRSETAIGRAAVSMASAAVELAQKVFGRLAGKTVLTVGAGEMAELAARHLKSAGASRILMTNRTFAKAQALADEVGGEARRYEEMDENLLLADVVVTCTASPVPIFTRENVGVVVKKRKYRPLFFVDLAVPRDVEPDVTKLDGVYAYDVDDVQKIMADNAAARAAEAARAEVIVAEEVARFAKLRAQREGVPLVATLRKHAERIARTEAEKTLQNVGEALSDKQRKSIEAMAMAIVNKLLHQPTAKLRAVGVEDERLVDAAVELFGLDPEGPDVVAGGAKR